jgi:hypothetical protein
LPFFVHGVQNPHLTGDDFDALPLLAGTIFPGPALQLPFNEDLPALCEVFTADFGQLPERDNAEPLHDSCGVPAFPRSPSISRSRPG